MKRLFSLRIIFFLIFALISPHIPALAASQPETSVYVHPSVVHLAPGESEVITIRIADVEELRAFEVQISFDQSRIYVKPGSPSDGAFLGAGFGSPDNAVDNQAGTITFGKAITGDDVVSGSGSLFSFEVQAQGSTGIGLITIAEVDLVHANHFPIPHQIQHGSVHITGEDSGYQVYLPLILQ